MLAYVVGDGLQRFRRGLNRLANPGSWMDPFLERAVIIVHESNRAGLMMGRDIDGKPFDKVKRTTGGPPLLFKAYRAINYAIADAGQIDRNNFEVRISWPEFKSEKGRDILAMHMKPYGNRPARRAVGIRKDAVDDIRAEWRRFAGRQLREFTNTPNVATSPTPGTEQFSGVIRGRR